MLGGLEGGVVGVLSGLDIGGKIEGRAALCGHHHGQEHAADTAIAISERVDSLEMGVGDGHPGQQTLLLGVQAVRAHIGDIVREAARDPVRWRGIETGIGDVAPADPNGDLAQPSRPVRIVGVAAHHALVDVADEAWGEDVGPALAGLADVALQGGGITADKPDGGARVGIMCLLRRQQLIEGAVGSLDGGTAHRFLAGQDPADHVGVVQSGGIGVHLRHGLFRRQMLRCGLLQRHPAFGGGRGHNRIGMGVRRGQLHQRRSDIGAELVAVHEFNCGGRAASISNFWTKSFNKNQLFGPSLKSAEGPAAQPDEDLVA